MPSLYLRKTETLEMAVALPLDATARLAVETSPHDALVDLLNRYERPLCNYLRLVMGHSDAVFDCAQDAFLRAYEHLSRGRSVNSQWLYKVARNRAIDHLRRNGRVESDTGALDEFPALFGEPSQQTHRVRKALASMPVADRELLYLAIVDRFSTQEIGAMLQIRGGAVRVRLFRARERFRTTYGAIE